MLPKLLTSIFGSRNERLLKGYRRTVQQINALEPKFEALSDDELRGKTQEFKQRIAAGETVDDILPEAFAVCREASVRVLGMRHFDVQMIGGMVLHNGKIAEMRTGEGKTLVGTLPVYLNALKGEGVHVITVNDFKRGLRILLDGEPYVILDVHAQSPSARGAATITKLKVRNLRTSAVFEKSFRGSEKLEQPDLEFRPVQFLYRDDEGFHFMDTGSYEQVCLKEDEVGEGAGFLKEGLEDIRSVVFNGKVISVDLPNTVVLRVEETTPFIKGGTAQAQTKPALLETGMTIQVPAYMESGEDIVVDTREARFVSRAKG